MARGGLKLIAIALHDGIGDQIWIKRSAGRGSIALQSDARDSQVLTV